VIYLRSLYPKTISCKFIGWENFYMSLQIIYGRAGSGKSMYALNKIKKTLDEKNETPVFLLVPEQFTFQAEKNLSEILGSGGILKTEVLSFKRMAHRVFTEVGGVTTPQLHAAGKSMILANILSEKENEFVFLKGLSKHKGFVESLSSLIKEFKRYNVTPIILEKASLRVDFQDKLKELAFLYQAYEDEVSKRYKDTDDDLTLLAKKIPLSKTFQNSIIWIDEFSTFTPQEILVLDALMEKAKHIQITLCCDSIDDSNLDPYDVFYPVKKGLKNLLQVARKNKIEILSPIDLNANPLPRFLESPELSHLEKNFFRHPCNSYPKKNVNTAIFSAINIYSEVENVAKNILALAREKKLRYKDIRVVCRNLETYEKIISVIFKTYQLPFFIDQKREVSNHPLVRMILSLFDILTGNWSYERIFSYLKTGLTQIPKEDIDLLENYVLACGIRGSQWTMNGDWRHKYGVFSLSHKHEPTDEFYQKINTIRQKVVEPILDFSYNAKGHKTPIQIARALFQFLCKIELPKKIEEKIEFLRSKGELLLANEYTQVFGMVMDALDQLVEVLEDKPIALDRFGKFLSIGLEEYRLGVIPPALDQVMIASVERSRSHRVKALFVLGVNDGVFPSSDFQEGLLSDQDRSTLHQLGIPLSEDAKAKALEEQYLIYRTLTTPSHFLRLSYSLGDLEGKGLRPSTIISRFKKVFVNSPRFSDLIEDECFAINQISSKIPSFDQLTYHFRKGFDKGWVEKPWLDVYSWYSKQPDWQEILQGLSYGLGYNNIPSNISSLKAKKLYGSPMYTSVSKIEKFASCPFSYFIQYGLKARERKLFKMGAPDVGNFLHIAIETFSKSLEKENQTWRTFDSEWAAVKVEEIVEELVAKMMGVSNGGSYRMISLVKRLDRVVNRVVWVISQQIRRGNFEVYGYELDFGTFGSFPPIQINTPNGDVVYLTGRIDRVDILENEQGTYVRIVDYKSAGKQFDLLDIYHGLQIQLLTYFDAICENSGNHLKAPVLPGGIFYLRLDDPLIKENLTLSDELIQKAVLKKLKMQGVYLKDVSLVREMDLDLKGYSSIIPAFINKDESLGTSSSFSLEAFELLRKYVKKLLTVTTSNMLNGDVSLMPYKKQKDTACKYCKFITLCHFDPRISSNEYKLITKKEESEILELMKFLD
jgi:ATP-dependent helicase/nuclease subunit B